MVHYTDEQLRTLANLAQAYEAWLEAARSRRGLPYGMRWKTVSGREYLYEITDRFGNGKSLGPRSAENEQRLETYRKARADVDERSKTAWARVEEAARIGRALRLPALAEPAGRILREFDLRGMLAPYLLVAGTNALLAYNLEAAGPIVIGADMATDDFDLVWSRDHGTSLLVRARAESDPPSLLEAMKEVDETYTVNEERPFQIRNSKAYEVEILVPPAEVKHLPKADRLRPVKLEEVEWLIGGTTVDQIVPVKGEGAARVISPDPRLFALQKLWLAKKRTRDSLKRPKDDRQGTGILDACASGALPRHPLNRSFVASLPEALVPHFERWAKARGFTLKSR
jgi:hypothetical protein